MSLRKFKIESLAKKLELKGKLQKELAEIDSDIDEVTGDKKSKIKRTSLKK